jgi:hypothetical protein
LINQSSCLLPDNSFQGLFAAGAKDVSETTEAVTSEKLSDQNKSYFNETLKKLKSIS